MRSPWFAPAILAAFTLMLRSAVAYEQAQAALKLATGELSADVNHAQEFSCRSAFFSGFDDIDAPPEFASVDDVLAIASVPAQPAQFAIASRPWKPSAQIRSTSNGPIVSARAPFGPDVSDRATVINLAKMTSDAYVLDPSQPDWLNTSLKFNYSSSFGWDADGLRGHVFADTWNKTIIVAFKGTTVFPGSKWRYHDRLNDNLLFSCCCGAQRPDPYPYQPVCDCPTETYHCNSTCLTQELGHKDRYYASALQVMFNITASFPGSEFWVVGHSLGGALASLMGLTFNFPAVTFESPPERLPAHRLGLLESEGPPVYHLGNTADPIFEGACNGWSSSCGVAGYAFESQCFTGKRCAYDTVNDLGWHLSIANHRINTVISDVLEAYNSTPECTSDIDSGCVDCYSWNFSSSVVQRGQR